MMNNTNTATRVRSVISLLAVACGILALSSAPAAAQGGFGTNDIPYANGFETYSNGTFIVGAASGWYASEPDTIRVVTTNYSGVPQYPLADPPTTHTNVLLKTDSTPITNLFNEYMPGSDSSMWVDFTIQPRAWDDSPLTADTNDVLTAIYITSNGNIAAYCSLSPDGGVNFTNAWIIFPDRVDSGQWVRLTVQFTFEAATAELPIGSYDWFKIRFNNSSDLTSPLGQVTPEAWTSSDGPWFMCAKNQGRSFHSVVMSGAGMLDDLVVTNGIPSVLPKHDILVLSGAGSTVVYGTNPPTVKGNGSVQAVLENGNASFFWTAAQGYDITNSAWGVGSGAGFATNLLGSTATNFTFTNVLTDMTLSVLTKVQPRYLVISNSPGIWGVPNPTNNVVHTYNYGELVTCSISGSPYNDGSWTQQVVGFTRTISSPAGLTYATNTSFTITGATTSDVTCVTWVWTPQYWLDTRVSGIGFVSPDDGWHLTGDGVNLAATVNAGSSFITWTGNTNGIGDPTNASTSITMDQARVLTANFTGSTNRTAHGTLQEWLQQYYTCYGTDGFEDADTNDWDGDGLMAWQEFITGTDPSNSNSVFVVLSQGALGGSNYVKFYGSDRTNFTPVDLPFGMLRCTNLVVTPFGLYGSSIPRSSAVNGTNTWWDTSPATSTPAFYRPVATNVWP